MRLHILGGNMRKKKKSEKKNERFSAAKLIILMVAILVVGFMAAPMLDMLKRSTHENNQESYTGKRVTGKKKKQRTVKKRPTQKKISDAELQQRLQAFKSWVYCADKIVTQTNAAGYTAPNLVLQGYAKHAWLARPNDTHPHGIQRIATFRNRTTELFAVVPMLKKDENTKAFEPFRDRNSTGTTLAYHRATSKAIFINTTLRFSCPMRGVTALHEGMHAFRYSTGKTPLNPAYANAEEVFTLIFEGKILKIIGGNAYTKVLNELHISYLADMRKNGTAAFYTKPDARVEKFFGVKSASDLEVAARVHMVNLHAFFSAIDSITKNIEDRLKMKRRFYRQLSKF